jgi:signal transduction histidine kinase/DNA-binding response OmpR family regulator
MRSDSVKVCQADGPFRPPLVELANAELRARLFKGIYTYLVVIAIMGLSTDAFRRHPRLMWSAAALILSGVLFRGALVVVKGVSHSRNPERWWMLIAISVGILSGTCGCLHAVLLALYGFESWPFAVSMIWIAGLATGGSIVFIPYMRLVWMHVLLMEAPVSLVSLGLGGVHGTTFALTVALFVVFLISQARRLHTAYWKAMVDRELEGERRRELEELSQAKSQFLANMSHEIRTPLNGIIGFTGLLLDDRTLTLDQREAIETVRTSGDVLLLLINDILDLSKIEAGKMQIEKSPFDLHAIFEEVAQMMAAKAESKKLDLIVDYSPGTVSRFIGDAGRVRQVLTNLVGNAIKFTDQGQVVIQVEAESAEGVAQVHVAVKDTGVGIPAEKLPQLFQKFTQLDSSAKRRFEGTGLGLAVSKQLVELMGGTIRAESVSGKGSTFRFNLPLQLDTKAPEHVAEPGLNGLRVLIVSDNGLTRRVVNEQVASWGMRADSPTEGSNALDELRTAAAARDPYSFVIFDDAPPGIVGIAAAIKGDPALSENIIIALTSIGVRTEWKDSQPAVIDSYLVKPVRQSRLMNTLAECWTRHTEPRPTGAAIPVEVVPVMSANPLRVLVVEDNAVNQRVAVKLLERLGFRADLAADGREAVEMSGLLSYDLIFMDCQMPEMDGYEATRAIRARPGRGNRIPIVAMTAEALTGCKEACLAAGMDDFVSKPVSLLTLAGALKKWGKPQTSPPHHQVDNQTDAA